ncbi:hypothetical protein HID58_022201, partial [Brassica napus]
RPINSSKPQSASTAEHDRCYSFNNTIILSPFFPQLFFHKLLYLFTHSNRFLVQHHIHNLKHLVQPPSFTKRPHDELVSIIVHLEPAHHHNKEGSGIVEFPGFNQLILQPVIHRQVRSKTRLSHRFVISSSFVYLTFLETSIHQQTIRLHLNSPIPLKTSIASSNFPSPQYPLTTTLKLPKFKAKRLGGLCSFFIDSNSFKASSNFPFSLKASSTPINNTILNKPTKLLLQLLIKVQNASTIRTLPTPNHQIAVNNRVGDKASNAHLLLNLHGLLNLLNPKRGNGRIQRGVVYKELVMLQSEFWFLNVEFQDVVVEMEAFSGVEIRFQGETTLATATFRGGFFLRRERHVPDGRKRGREARAGECLQVVEKEGFSKRH